MFDDVPARVWLLLLIPLVAFRPVQYVYRHITSSPARRDITQPREDLGWRSTRHLARSLSILAALTGLAAFIFTPTAEQFASSPRFLPALLAASGMWTCLTVVQGLRTGQIQPLVKGFYETYGRQVHPKRYWASIVWNAVVSCFIVWAAYQANREASEEVFAGRCVKATNVPLLSEQLAACGEQIRLRPKDKQAYMDRGMLLLDAWALDPAIADFNRAHDLDPTDPWPLANRGVAFAWKKDQVQARRDFDAVREIDPTNPVMLRGETVLSTDAGDMKGALAQVTASMRREPDNLWALRTRSELYWELGDQEKSMADDRRWVQLKREQNVAADQSREGRLR
jgi:tetratricopeptide (TPR) repeat protein